MYLQSAIISEKKDLPPEDPLDEDFKSLETFDFDMARSISQSEVFLHKNPYIQPKLLVLVSLYPVFDVMKEVLKELYGEFKIKTRLEKYVNYVLSVPSPVHAERSVQMQVRKN